VYLPKAEPKTPTTNTNHTLRAYFICNKVITVHAGGPKKGTQSTRKDAIKTKT
jgi:hypothetical protein